MKLKSVSVTRLFDMFDHAVEVRPEGLTFIHSPNGYGKSTFLRMIYLALKGETKELEEIKFERMDLGFTDGSAMILEEAGDGLRVQMSRTEIEHEVSEDEMSSILDVTYISSERMVVKKMDGRLVPALEAYASEFSERVRNAKENSSLSDVTGEDMGDDELVFWSKDLKAKLDFIKEAGFEANIPSGLRFPPSRKDVNDSHTEYLDLAYSIEDFVERNYYLAESMVVFKDIINGLMIGKNAVINENGTIGIELDNGTSLPLSRLSSGEKQILLIFYRLLFHATPGSLVIMDEPEISLHVSWQQQMAKIFIDVARLRDLQMIVTTHSPQIVHDRWDLANELRVDRA